MVATDKRDRLETTFQSPAVSSCPWERLIPSLILFTNLFSKGLEKKYEMLK